MDVGPGDAPGGRGVAADGVSLGSSLIAGRSLVGGEQQPCGWLKDKYGVSWQIVPRILSEMINDPDSEKSGRVMEAMLQMKKVDIGGLKRAFNG